MHTPTTEDTTITPECTSSDARSATDKATHTHEHLDLSDLDPRQRWALAIAADPWLNDTSLADQIRDGRADRLPLDEIDHPDHDAKTELADSLYAAPDPWFHNAAQHLEWASIRDRCARDHSHWRTAPDWCVCADDTPRWAAA